MARRTARDWSIEEFEAWKAAADRVDAVAEAADEEGGPRLSLVSQPDRREVWLTDLLPPAEGVADGAAPIPAMRNVLTPSRIIAALISAPDPPWSTSSLRPSVNGMIS